MRRYVSFVNGLLYSLMTALSVVLIHYIGQFVTPALTLFIGSGIAIIVFHTINIPHIKQMYKHAWQAKWEWLSVMLIIVWMWLCTIYGPTYVRPDIFLLFFFTSNFLLGTFFKFFLQKQKIYFLLSTIAILACTAIIYHDFIIHQHDFTHPIVGVLLGTLGGISTFIYSKQSYALIKDAHLESTQILAIRFWLIQLICPFFIPVHSFSALSLHEFGWIVVVAFVSLILPIFCFLKSVNDIGPEKTAIIVALTPPFTYIANVLLVSHRYDLIVLLVYCLVSAIICFSFVKGTGTTANK